MDLSLFLVADYATATSDGKMTLVGVFNALHALTFPTTHPDMTLVVQLLASPHEGGRTFNLTIRLVDQDGQKIVDVTAVATVPESVNGRDIPLNNILKLVNVTFPRPGTYQFTVLIDNDHKGDLVLDVFQIPTPT